MIKKYHPNNYYNEGEIVDVYGTICKVHEWHNSNCKECCFIDMENEVCQFMNCRTLDQNSLLEADYINFEKLSEIEVLVLKGKNNEK